MQQRSLGQQGLQVSAIGLGCMGLTPIYGEATEADAIATVHRAIALGVNFLDSSDAYAFGLNEERLAKAIAGRRDGLIIATKFGQIRHPDGSMDVSGKPDYVIQACEASLKRLKLDVIDLYYQHRVDTTVAIEDTVGAMVRLKEQGKIRYLGLSEAAPQTISTRSQSASDHGRCRPNIRCGRATSRTKFYRPAASSASASSPTARSAAAS